MRTINIFNTTAAFFLLALLLGLSSCEQTNEASFYPNNPNLVSVQAGMTVKWDDSVYVEARIRRTLALNEPMEEWRSYLTDADAYIQEGDGTKHQLQWIKNDLYKGAFFPTSRQSLTLHIHWNGRRVQSTLHPFGYDRRKLLIDSVGAYDIIHRYADTIHYSDTTIYIDTVIYEKAIRFYTNGLYPELPAATGFVRMRIAGDTFDPRSQGIYGKYDEKTGLYFFKASFANTPSAELRLEYTAYSWEYSKAKFPIFFSTDIWPPEDLSDRRYNVTGDGFGYFWFALEAEPFEYRYP